MNTATRYWTCVASALMLAALTAVSGCGTTGGRAASTATTSGARPEPVVRHVRCLYDTRPWLNQDAAGDRDPEGIHYRVYLDRGDGTCRHVTGTFLVQMYQIDRTSADNVKRTLASDWLLPTDSDLVSKLEQPGMLGDGYHLRLRWAKKDTAGKEIEILTKFRDVHGNVIQSGTKRFRVPKYAS